MLEIDAQELTRLRELAALQLADDIEDPRLQALVERAATELRLPVAAVSIVLDAAQYFIASHGLGDWLARVSGTPDEWAFCRHAVRSRAPFVVEDACTHALTEHNPLVRFDGIRSYLGVPLITSADQPIGTLCVLGTAPRAFSSDEILLLRTLADEVLRVLEARRA